MTEENKILALSSTIQMYVYDGVVMGDPPHLTGDPASTCSGCFYKDVILSVLHGCPEKENQILTAFVRQSTEGSMYQVLNPQWMSLGIINDNGTINLGDQLDFIVANYVKNQDYYSEFLDEITGQHLSLSKHKFNEIITPNEGEEFFFFGNTRVSFSDTEKRIFSVPRFSSCTFCGLSDEPIANADYYFKFCLPEVIQDFKDYKGCSGAPILNSKGQLVSLVCRADKIGSPYIYGVNLKKILPILGVDEIWE